MHYLTIISLADAKTYLRVDDTLTEDDANITRMINAALSQVEVLTNHILYARNNDYLFINEKVNVYDYPINSLESPTENITTVKKTLYNTYCTSDSTQEILTLNVGYENADDIPQELIEVAYEMIEIMYPESDKKTLSPMSKIILSNYKRFLL